MHVRDASGRQVSLLNDDYQHGGSLSQRSSCHTPCMVPPQSYHGRHARSPSPFASPPELLRSDSYDSQVSAEPLTPVTPIYDYLAHGYACSSVEARSPYKEDQYVSDAATYGPDVERPSAAFSESQSTPCEDETMTAAGTGLIGGERSGKRYPCRYRDSHGCEKTFTTSGHASRHSKIHTAEKAVPCSHPGCIKKFTRADNMKQHLETHFKDKFPRASSSARPALASKTASGRSKAQAASTPTPIASPEFWDARGGLDALAAVACQEGT